MTQRAESSDGYLRVLREVSELLSKHGYRKRGNVYWQDNGDLRSVIGLQKSSTSTKDRVVFTINFSIIVKPLLDPEFDNMQRMESYGGHLYWRVGNFLKPPQDKWWTIIETSDTDHVSESVHQVMAEVALPEFHKVSSVRNVMEVLNSESAPPMGEKQKQRLIQDIMRLLP